MYSTFLPRDYSQVGSFPTTLQRLRYGPAEQDEGKRDQVAHFNSSSQLISPGLGWGWWRRRATWSPSGGSSLRRRRRSPSSSTSPLTILTKVFYSWPLPDPETELKESIRYLEFLFRTKSREGSKGEPAFNKDCSGPLEADLLGQGHWKGLKIIWNEGSRHLLLSGFFPLSGRWQLP